jgi:hypothetical protein
MRHVADGRSTSIGIHSPAGLLSSFSADRESLVDPPALALIDQSSNLECVERPVANGELASDCWRFGGQRITAHYIRNAPNGLRAKVYKASRIFLRCCVGYRRISRRYGSQKIFIGGAEVG